MRLATGPLGKPQVAAALDRHTAQQDPNSYLLGSDTEQQR